MYSSPRVPTPIDAEQAQKALKQLSSLTPRRGGKTASRRLELKAEGASTSVTITLPADALNRFLEVLAAMANGNAVTIVPVHAELTTQEAADILHVSRPYLVSLLNQGLIPHRVVGTHRRVRYDDLMAYREHDDKKRSEVLDELAADAQANGFGY